MNKERKLVYVLPEASEKTHMKYNVEFVTALAKEKGVEVFLILERGFEGGGYAAAQNLHQYLENLKSQTGASQVRYTGTSILTRIPRLKLFLLEAMFRGYRKVYIHYSFVSAIYASLNPFFKTYYWNCGIPWQYKRPFFQEMYETFAYKVITHFVTGAKVLTDKYVDYYNFNNNKSIVIPNWIDVEKNSKILNQAKNSYAQDGLKKELDIENKKVLFFNQRLAERKGAHYIPYILEHTEQDVVMMITNDGPYRQKLIEILKEKKLFERVRMLGRVPNDKVIKLLSVTDIYVLPSEEEGMSHSLMEAFVVAVPAVSFNVGGTLDMYPDEYKQFVLPEKQIQSFVEKVNMLLVNKDLSKNFGEALFEKVKEYDKKVVIKSFIDKVIDAI